MALYELSATSIKPLEQTTFAADGVFERRDLQRLLRDAIEVISPDTLVIDEEFGDWEDSARRIDLLGVDRAANLVVIELKRTDDGGHMELQALSSDSSGEVARGLGGVRVAV
jgi:RecB family endonuclease NucS